LKNKTGFKNHFITFSLLLLVIIFNGQMVSAEIRLSRADLNLTSKEIKWLKSNKSITIGGPKAFPPFHYFDMKGNLKGISADYIFTMMDQLGVKLTIQKNIPWPEVLKRAKSGEIDLIPCAAKTKDREVYLNFSTPYLSFPLVILSRKDAPFIGGIDDLYGKKLAIIKKNAVPAWLSANNIKYEAYYVKSPLKKLEAVSLSRADAVIENLAAATYIIQKYGITNVKIAAPTEYGNYNLHIAVRKDLPELLGIVNKVIYWIKPEEHMKIRNKWLSVRYEHGISQTDILRWILITLFGTTVMFLIVFRWNRKLQKEIAQRVKVIVELEEALAENKTLKGIVPICASCKKIRDDKGYWNLLESFIEKNSEASFSHGMCPECADVLYGKESWYSKKNSRS
jgi:two-component system sensor histidine kinase EvgS